MKNSKSDRSVFSISLKFLVVGLLLLSIGISKDVKATPISVSFQVFYDELSPFGDWIDDPNYGFVWVPRVEQNFQPYRSNGRWVMTSYGNTWVSQYDWGWAPFHYGRWFYSDLYGWAWIPGYEWGPAWVNWRSGRGYYGWIPLGPQTYFYASNRFPIYSHWVFVPRRRLLSRNIYRYFLPGRNVNVIYNQTTVINNTYVYNNNTYISGPSRSELRRVTRSNVPVFEVSQGRRPGRTSVEKNSIRLYKPEISSSRTSSRNIGNSRPKNYMSAREFGRARSTTLARSGNRRSTTSATSPRTANVRSETLRNSRVGESRSVRGSVNSNVAASNQRQQRVSPYGNFRSNSRLDNTNARSRNSYTSPNNRSGQRAATSTSRPDSRKIIPNYRESKRSSSVYQRKNATPKQRRVLKQSVPTQKQIRKTTPSGSSASTRRIAPSRRQSSSIQRAPKRSNTRINSSSRSRSQTRSAPSRQRSQRSTTTRSIRSGRGN